VASSRKEKEVKGGRGGYYQGEKSVEKHFPTYSKKAYFSSRGSNWRGEFLIYTREQRKYITNQNGPGESSFHLPERGVLFCFL